LLYLIRYNCKYIEMQTLKVLIKERDMFSYVSIFLNIPNATYYPIFYYKKFKQEETESMISAMSTNSLEIDTKSGNIIVKPGWIVSKFGTTNLFTDESLILNSNKLSLSGVKLSYMLSDCNLLKLITNNIDDFLIVTVDKNVIRGEMEEISLNHYPVSRLQDKIERFEVYLDMVNIKTSSKDKIELKFHQSSMENIVLNPVIGLKDDKMGGKEFSSKDQINKMLNITSEDEEKIMLNLAETIDWDVKSDDEDDLLDFRMIIPETTPQEFIILEDLSYKSNFKSSHIIERVTKMKKLWIELLEAVTRNMLIDDIFYSKNIVILLTIFCHRYPNYKTFIQDPFYAMIWNNIFQILVDKLMYTKMELINAIPCTLRLEKGLISIYVCKYCVFDKLLPVEEERKYIIADGIPDYNYLFKKTLFERKANESELKKIFDKYKSIDQNPQLFTSRYSDPLVYTIFHTDFTSIEMEMTGDWI